MHPMSQYLDQDFQRPPIKGITTSSRPTSITLGAAALLLALACASSAWSMDTPYNQGANTSTRFVRPDPGYRITDYEGMGVPKHIIDQLISEVKYKLANDPYYIKYKWQERYQYNNGVPPSGDQLEADANYIVERYLGGKQGLYGEPRIDIDRF